MGLTQQDLANAIHVPYQRVNELVNQKRGITPGTALRLAKFFGVSPGLWLNLQMKLDLSKAMEAEEDALGEIDALPGLTLNAG